jgi:uncharacterized membrane protein YfcA
MTVTSALLALAIGTGMGLLGGGGSIVAVPAFTFFLHQQPKEAVVTSLAVVGLAAAVGAIGAFLRGAIPVATALVVGVAATVGAYAGGLVGARLSDEAHLLMLAPVMFGAAILLWRPPAATRAIASPSRTALALVGAGVGVFTGVVGVGGGFLIVPALMLAAGLTMRQAAAASLFVIALSALAGLLGYVNSAPPAWSFVMPFAAVAAAGTLAGSSLAWWLPQRLLQQAFAVSLVVLGSFVLTRL